VRTWAKQRAVPADALPGAPHAKSTGAPLLGLTVAAVAPGAKLTTAITRMLAVAKKRFIRCIV
jgi:hypothetical protein